MNIMNRLPINRAEGLISRQERRWVEQGTADAKQGRPRQTDFGGVDGVRRKEIYDDAFGVQIMTQAR